MEVVALAVCRLVRRVKQCVLHCDLLLWFSDKRWVEGAFLFKLLFILLQASNLIGYFLTVPAQASLLHLFLVLVGWELLLHHWETEA